VGRRNRPKRDEAAPIDLSRASGGRRTETKRGEDWIVQDIAGPRAIKEYVCPGCVIPIEIGIPHVVTWHYEGLFGEEAAVRDRRHWHTSCWKMY
jgi:hypothetical protein